MLSALFECPSLQVLGSAHAMIYNVETTYWTPAEIRTRGHKRSTDLAAALARFLLQVTACTD